MNLTLIHPCVGRRPGEPYIKSWQMEPLPPATIAGLTPPDVAIRFFDDRMERIDFDAPADLVALSVETYTARRSYQIASEYRKRGVPVVMGGFHATLCPDEVTRYAEAVVLGEAEVLWPQVLDDFRSGRLQKVYTSDARLPLAGTRPDRSIFRGKRYLPLSLVEASRGCHFGCEFCAITSYFSATHRRRSIADILAEVEPWRDGKKLVFFVDDNIVSDMAGAREFLCAIAPLNLRWVGQASITVAHDEEFLTLLAASGCYGLLIGFESLNPENLRIMNKTFNTAQGGFPKALANLRRHGIRLYVTFVFGYDADTHDTFAETAEFAKAQAFYISSFNHLTPFPGTPLYARLKREGRLLYDAWWMDERYRYNGIPFQPKLMSPAELQQGCLEARRRFYTWPSIVRRSLDPVNRADWSWTGNALSINALFRAEVGQRDGYPLGDAGWRGELIPAA